MGRWKRKSTSKKHHHHLHRQNDNHDNDGNNNETNFKNKNNLKKENESNNNNNNNSISTNKYIFFNFIPLLRLVIALFKTYWLRIQKPLNSVSKFTKFDIFNACRHSLLKI